MPEFGTDTPPSEQGFCDLPVGCSISPCVSGTQHLYEPFAFLGGEPGVGCAPSLPMAYQPVGGRHPIQNLIIEWNERGWQRKWRLSTTQEC